MKRSVIFSSFFIPFFKSFLVILIFVGKHFFGIEKNNFLTFLFYTKISSSILSHIFKGF